MPFVLLTVAQKIAMKLFDMVFGDGNILPGLENRFHGLGIASTTSCSSRVSNFLISSLPNRCSTSRLLSLLPSMRVEEPMLSIVAMRRRAFNRSSAKVPRARQAPLNSSISDSKASNSGVIWIDSVFIIPEYIPDYTGMSTGIIAGLCRNR